MGPTGPTHEGRRPASWDAPLTRAHGELVKIVGWYDNEWGHTNHPLDLTACVTARLPQS
ncbi:hypothetical protein [Streptomyces vastus]|uniref:Glyceraldehyde 3-phosphate dehydrogenase catalytic domain-containing protein n=1 Tax=Streptomyces vastus TaxID=285451 RepID=A0ABN3RL29_9ACTN